MEEERLKKAGVLVGLGAISYFGVSYYDSIRDFLFPFDLIFLVITTIFLLFITYYALGIQTK